MNQTTKLGRVGLLRPSTSGQLKEIRRAALALKLKLEEIEIQLVDAKGLASAFQTAKQNRSTRLW
jgi:hypothetical protein